ncbi:MAG: FkbM family methyltransferase [Bacteroidia bacterium]
METSLAVKLLNGRTLVVADAGARNGFQLFPQFHRHTELYAFEPDPVSFHSLKEKYKTFYPFRKAEVFQLALADKASTMKFYPAKHPSMSSLLQHDRDVFRTYTGRMADSEHWAEGFHQREEIDVQTETLDYWAASKQIGYIDFLKLDTQGSELLILHGATDLLRNKQIGVVFTEVSFAPLYKNQCSFTELDLWMKHCGYRLADLRTYPEIANYLSRSSAGRVTEQPRFGMTGDAAYVPADRNSYRHPESVALLLAALGYYSQSEALLAENNLLSGNETEQLFRELSQQTFRQKLKHILRRITPPIVHYWYSRLIH